MRLKTSAENRLAAWVLLHGPMARRWSSDRHVVADMRCGMRVTPTPHMRVTHRCAAAEGSAGEGGFFSTHNEGDRCLHIRSYTRSPRGSP